ncbi:MAG: bifunctional folylpolyglutamate synthase/dihydrofolate synthase [Anaerolineales bacterium]|nr:bifunctional folylpolyglutamate synthase/dihydrofolate synthase [Anaerolineales bacterium]MCX7608208.1 bifunctional folylpolyglutamate synthase/dihydrofolate synthase [Anaerolineales bacterium]MDW8227029.1 folylpolyglutamate synthase/dihydrofolate synthase family protein [Anaerolineales bacterium]
MDNEELAYNRALDYLYSFIDYSLKKETDLAKAEFKLERVRTLLARLGNPHRRYPILHVAGTKGKGSTSALLASALTAAGYRTGLYTSPHLQDYAERIQLNGVPIPHGRLAALVEEIRPHVEGIEKITTFEITTALAFLYFAQEQADAAVIEVGLGGRLDATNVVEPNVAVITSISYDHMFVLGDTLAQIAAEKGGIIKPGVPVVSSPQKEEALEVLVRIAAERGSPFTLVGRDVLYQPLEHSLEGQTFSIVDSKDAEKSVILRIPLLGLHQVENAATAYAALKRSGLQVSEQGIWEGFASVRWPCRFEIARREPPLIFDVAHNEDSFLRLRQTLDEYYPGRPIVLLMGVSRDKVFPAMLAQIAPRLGHLVAIRSSHPRALEAETIVETAKRLGVNAEAAPTVEAGLERALALSEADNALLLVAGSIFSTAEVKTAWEHRMAQSASKSVEK